MRSIPVLMDFLPRFAFLEGSLVSAALRLATTVSPPAPNRMLSLGLALRPWLWALPMRRNQPSGGNESKPPESATTTKLNAVS